MEKLQEIILWTKTAKPCEQVFMLKLIAKFGDSEFKTTFREITLATGVSEHNLSKLLPRLKRLGWLKWTRTYGEGMKNLKYVTGCLYEVTVSEASEPPAAPSEG
jgi:DNA-binding IclR family transcriptional regulator